MKYAIFILILLTSTLVACGGEGTWERFTTPQNIISVELPKQPQHISKNLRLGIGKTNTNIYRVAESDRTFTISYLKIPKKENQSKELTKILNEAREGNLDEFKGKIIYKKKIQQKGFSGYEFQVHTPDGEKTRFAQMYISNKYFIMLIVETSYSGDMPAWVNKFFNSVKLSNS